MMFIFTSPALVAGKLEYAITRKDNNQYLLILSRSRGMAATRNVAHLNHTTSADPLALSTQHRPCLWLDADLDRDPRNLGPESGVLDALLVAEPRAPIKRTGRTKMVFAAEGGEREAVEVEVLLSEDELAQSCYYCGTAENAWDGNIRFKHIGGEGYTSVYMCSNCAKTSAIRRSASRILRTGRIW